MVGRTNGEASHTMPCALSSPPVETPPGTPCNPVFVEGFENPRIANQWGYDFYTHLPGWVITSPDNAIEFQDVRTGGPAQEGDQYAELDTVGYNSTISKYINLNPGLFEIRFYYRPELWNTPNPNSHTMQFCFESATSPLCQNYKDHYSDVMAWREVKKALTIQRAGNYRISFRGTGLPDHDGAQIDNIRLCRL
jgi:hypothetical protein